MGKERKWGKVKEQGEVLLVMCHVSWGHVVLAMIRCWWGGVRLGGGGERESVGLLCVVGDGVTEKFGRV